MNRVRKLLLTLPLLISFSAIQAAEFESNIALSTITYGEG